MTRSTVLRLEDVVMDAMKPFPPLDQSSDCGESCRGIFIDGIIDAWAVLILLLSNLWYYSGAGPKVSMVLLYGLILGGHKAPNGLAQTINQRFKPWFKPMVFKRFNNFLNRFKTGLGFQTNRLTIDLYDYFIDIFNI